MNQSPDDVKAIVSDSSPEAAAPATEAQSDVAQDSSPETGVKSEQRESLADVVQRIKEKHSSQKSESPAEIEQKIEQEKKNPEQPSDVKTDKKEAELPFGKHPRFQELVKQKNDFEGKVKEYEGKVKELEPVAQRMQAVEKFCEDNQISAKDYDDALRLAAGIKTNPAEALKALEGIVQNLRISTGAQLPEDLQQDVDDGKLSQAHAQQLAKSRMETAQLKQQQERYQQSSTQRAQQELVRNLDAWTANKAKLDPGFKPNEASGKYEMVTDRFLRLWQEKKPTTPEAAVALAEEAYTQVSNYFTSLVPKPAVKRPLTSRPASDDNNKPVDTSRPGWAKEVAKRRLAEMQA
jgi:hypothetical protein